MKENDSTPEAGYTSSLADVLHSYGNPPVRTLTDNDLKKEYEYFKTHPIKYSANDILPHIERKVHMLSEKFRQERTKKNLSESELARRSGHAVSTIHGIENGDNENPGFKLVGDIAKVLEIPLDELYQATVDKIEFKKNTVSHD